MKVQHSLANHRVTFFKTLWLAIPGPCGNMGIVETVATVNTHQTLMKLPILSLNKAKEKVMICLKRN
jgi:hypothetical protein